MVRVRSAVLHWRHGPAAPWESLRTMPARAPKDPPEEQISFEAAYRRLEESVRALEEGGLPLEEATRLYEEGVRLARLCNELLGATELRVTRLQTSLGEQMRFLADSAPEEEEEEDDA